MLKTIRRGDKGETVEVAQLLTAYEPADGDYTEACKKHVAAWQKAHGLSADGIIGAKTWTEIALSAPTVSKTLMRVSIYAKAAQLLTGAEPDGIFGAKTESAVKTYQREHGLTADGIVGAQTWRSLITGEVASTQGINIQPPDFKQYDSRWASKMYSNHGDKAQTMKSSGCGPTAMADIVAEWWDKSITPYDLALKSLEWGCRTYDSGTSGTFFKKCADFYKAKSYKTASGIDAVKTCLDEGGYVIVCFGAGTKGKAGYQKWTKGGHYCCIWGYKGDTYYINDPASALSSRAKGTREEILNTRKGFYLFRR